MVASRAQSVKIHSGNQRSKILIVGWNVCVRRRSNFDGRNLWMHRRSKVGFLGTCIGHRTSTVGFHRTSGVEGRVFYNIMTLFNQVESECLIRFNEFDFWEEKTLNQKEFISKMFSFFNSNFRYMRRTRVPSKLFVLLLNLKTQMSKGLAFLRQ